jgi:predicted AlkP superfamily pyrophosphatase or phosphodiesterase
MKTLAALIGLAVSALGVGSSVSGVEKWGLEDARAAQRAAPRLIVILVADQFRSDYLERYKHRWRSGFGVLLDQGAVFARAEYPYLNTATCSGHVTIATGALPRTHGIILNRWWHRDERRAYNCMDDETAPHLSYGAPAQLGSSARRMVAPTLADRLRSERPESRVVSLSLKSRSAISLAGHGGDAVTWFDDASRSFVTSRAFAAAPVASVRAFITRDPPEADLGKIWTQQDADATYRQPDAGIGERPKAGWTALFPHPLLGAKGADAQFFDRWQKSPFADAYLGRMAASALEDLQLGQRETTDYLAVSFSSLDLLGHDFGPDSREVEDLLAHLDATIGALLQLLDHRVGRDNYVIALTSDHGVAPTPDRHGGGHIASEDLQHVAEQALIARWGAPPGAPYVAWVSSGTIYFSDGVFDRLQTDGAALQAVRGALLKVPGVMRILQSGDVSATSRDPLLRAAAAGYITGRSGDLFLIPKRLWVFELRAENEASQHGTFHDYDTRVPVLLRGYGIRPGRYGGNASPMDIAPTLARLAGVTLPNADGRVLREALR